MRPPVLIMKSQARPWPCSPGSPERRHPTLNGIGKFCMTRARTLTMRAVSPLAEPGVWNPNFLSSCSTSCFFDWSCLISFLRSTILSSASALAAFDSLTSVPMRFSRWFFSSAR